MNVVTMASPTWNKSESYGRIACEGRDYLQKKGVIVNTIGADAPNDLFLPTLTNILHGYPTNFKDFSDIANYGIKIVQTAWESTVLPPKWAENLNACTAVLVPCHWNAEVFKACGVTVPVHVVAEGISQEFHYQERHQRDVFRFIAIGDRGQRKGFIEAISAFFMAFGKRTDVELVIKSRSLAENSPLLHLTNSNIKVINEDYTDEQMQALYASCDCMIFPAHGEGFALPPREFAASGGIALATNYGGMADDIEGWGIPLPYKLVEAWPFHPDFKGLGEWPDADMEATADLMKKFSEMSLEGRNQIGKRFSDAALKLYQWNNYGESLYNHILTAQAEVESKVLANRQGRNPVDIQQMPARPVQFVEQKAMA